MKAIELPHLHGVRPEQLRRIRHVALDMDGTIYLGSNIFPWTLDFLDRLRSAGIGFSFLTNNPTRSVSDYLKKLAGMGIHVGEENMYSTPIATIDYIRKTWPQARRLFMLGTPSMASQFEEAGFTACTDDADDVRPPSTPPSSIPGSAAPPGGPRRAFPTSRPIPTGSVRRTSGPSS